MPLAITYQLTVFNEEVSPTVRYADNSEQVEALVSDLIAGGYNVLITQQSRPIEGTIGGK
jgi:hypothetical protein